jgi:hypothetical protein
MGMSAEEERLRMSGSHPKPALVGLVAAGGSALLVVIALVLGGGGSDASPAAEDEADAGSASNSSSAAGTGDDKKYTAAVCKAVQAYVTANTKAFGKMAKGDTESVAATNRAARERYDTLVRAIEKANPPADLKDYHAALISSARANAELNADLNKSFALLGAGGITVRGDGFSQERAVQRAAAARARVQLVADENPDCNGWTF